MVDNGDQNLKYREDKSDGEIPFVVDGLFRHHFYRIDPLK